MSKLKEGYKNTEIGVIPEDWGFALVEDVISDITMGPFGSDITVSNFVSSGVPVLNGYNISSERLKDEFSNYVTKEKAIQLKKAVARRGDVVITHRGTLGQIAYIPENSLYEEYVISQSQFRVTFKPSIINPHFIVSFFHSLKGQYILLQGKGHTGVPALAQPTTTFRKLRLPIPPIKEQQAIAEALADIDSLINALNKKIEKKKNIKQGAMQELLSGKRRLKGFIGKWENVKLGDCSKMYSGGTPYSANSEYYNGNIPFLSISDISNSNKYIVNTEKTITEKGLQNSTARLFPIGTIMYAMYASLGKCAISKIQLACSQAILGITVDLSIESLYIYYYLCFIENKITSFGQTRTQTNLSKQIVADFDIVIPPTKEEQTAIAQILTDMDNDIEQLEKKRDKYLNIKSGMMQQLLTGQMRLTKSM